MTFRLSPLVESRPYRHPESYRPPLALGGHCFDLVTLHPGHDDFYVTCLSCFTSMPAWALSEGFWMTLAGRWCPGAVRALPRGER
jgi:hypothetical protein